MRKRRHLNRLALGLGLMGCRRPPVIGANPIQNTVAPSIAEGDAAEGTYATANLGTWTGSPDWHNCQWYLDGVAIAGREGKSRKILRRPSFIGKSLTLGVTASTAGNSNTATSAAVQTTPATNQGSQQSTAIAVKNPNDAVVTAQQADIPITWISGMRSDFGDIRIFEGATALPYVIDQDSIVAGVSCTYTIKATWTNLESKTITIKYGGPNYVTSGDGKAVFELYDDFSSGSIDPTVWNQDVGADGAFVSVQDWQMRVMFDLNDNLVGQGGCANGTDIFIGTDNGDNVNGTIYHHLYDGTFVASFDGPPHSNAGHFRGNGNMVWCSAGSAVHVMWEIQTDGTVVRTWNFGSNLYYPQSGPNFAYVGEVTGGFQGLLVSATGGGGNYAVQLATMYDNGTYTLGRVWFIAAGTFGRSQQPNYRDGLLYFTHDDLIAGGDPSNSADISELGGVKIFDLQANGTAVQVDAWAKLAGKEREAAIWDGSQWLLLTHSGYVSKLIFNGRKGACFSGNILNSKRAYLRSLATFGTGYTVQARTAINRDYPQIGFVDSGYTEGVVLGHLSSAQDYLHARVRLASVNTDSGISSVGTSYKDLSLLEVKRLAGSVTYRFNGVNKVTKTTGLPTSDLPVRIGGETSTSERGFAQTIKSVAVRKALLNEPRVVGSGPDYESWTGPMWFDASDPTTITQSSGVVSAVANKRTTGGDLAYSGPAGAITYASAAINGRNVLRLAAAASSSNPPRLGNGSATAGVATMFQGNDVPHTVLMVYKPTDANTGILYSCSVQISGSSFSTNAFIRRAATASSIRRNSTGTAFIEANFGSGQAANSVYIMAVRFNGTTVDIWENSLTPLVSGGALDTAAISTSARFRLFAQEAASTAFTNAQGNLDFCEIVGEARACSDAEIQQAITDLAAKWGVTVS